MSKLEIMRRLKSVTVLIFLISISWNTHAQEDKAWNFTIAPYLYTPYTSGDIIVEGNEQDIYSAPSDILGELKMAGMLYLEAANAKWSVSADVLFLELGTDFNVPAPPAPAPVNGDLGADATLLGFYGMYRLADWFEIGAGARINVFDASLKLTSADTPPLFPEGRFKASDTWVDPVITYRFTVPIKNEKWHAGMRGDLGGFGVGSDFAWMIYPYGGYQFSRLFELSLGFRAMGIKYDNDSDLEVNLSLYGPQLGFLFHL